MHFNNHYNLLGKHAFLGASKYHWINYDREKLIQTYYNFLAVQEGTELHEIAATLIRKGIKLQKSKKTLNAYVNDAIGFRMHPEQVLYFSDNCFGTADAISFRNNFLRIHDLKTGGTPASINQLMVYAALFCLEYDKRPGDLKIELRIYQNDDVQILEPTPAQIEMIMKKIVEFDRVIDEVRGNEDE